MVAISSVDRAMTDDEFARIGEIVVIGVNPCRTAPIA
jgi:hypothetical protein